MSKNFTLNMAKSRLSTGYTHNNQDFVSFWDTQKTFHKANQFLSQQTSQSTYVLLDGPPYANGPLHLGHALNKNFKDLVVKSRWFMGQPVNFRPGWDCHGLPLELAVEKTHGKQEPAQLKQLCKELALSSVANHMQGFKSLGVLADWDNPYLTLSDEMLRSNWATLSDLFEKDLLVHKQYPVHYCPACASSLASAELETKLLVKDSLYFKMPLNGKYNNMFAVVWTTTPWTLPMNQALAYRDDFEYEVWSNGSEYLVLQNAQNLSAGVSQYLNEHNFVYSETSKLSQLLVNYTSTSPLSQLEVPLLQADFVEEGKTGFVHMSLAHGPEDFELGVRNGLSVKTYLNKNAVFQTENVPYLEELHGLNQTSCKTVVLDKLVQSQLLLEHSESMTEQNVCWRHKKAVFYNATWQVFLDLENPKYHLKNKVRALLDSSSLDADSKKQLSLMLFAREHWCLSRQRQWGCSMNLLVDKKTNKLSHHSKEFLNFYALGQEDKAQELLSNHPELEVFTDVLDVWFDSGNVVNTYALNQGSQSANFVVNMALEGKDQYRGWFQAMMWLCAAKNQKMPYENLFCHGFVLNKNKEKLSKSAGNSQGVEHYLSTYGGDTVHLWVASQEAGKDAVFSDEKLEEMKSLYSRLRLTLRFLSSNLYDYDHSYHQSNWKEFSHKENFDLERFTLLKMNQVRNVFVQNFKEYNFNRPLEELYEFTNKTLSNFFFDWAKNPLYLRKLKSEERLKLQTACFELFNGLLDMVKVYAPFVAEEFYQDYYGKEKSVFETWYFTPEKVELLNNLQVNLDWETVNNLRKKVLGSLDELQKQKLVKARTEVEVSLKLVKEQQTLLESVSLNYRLRDMLSVSNCLFDNTQEQEVQVTVLKNDTQYAKCPKCWNYNLLEQYQNSLELCTTCFNDEQE